MRKKRGDMQTRQERIVPGMLTGVSGASRPGWTPGASVPCICGPAEAGGMRARGV